MSASADKLILLFKNSGRVPRQAHSLHDEENKALNCKHGHGWRTIVCNNEEDVVECPDCGAQRLMTCNFDDDFA